MTDYSFERFSVLIVEDNAYMSSLLMQGLRALGVGQIRTTRHGGAAIELMQLMKTQPAKAGLMSIDLILSNWLMSPVDGAMLLRWVRRHKESPNRFMPFIMVTGYADRERVQEARDMGVTEMLTKPFSVQSIAQRIVQVIERPRQFVHTSAYFGPDRRRQDLGPRGAAERRITREDEIEIVYGER